MATYQTHLTGGVIIGVTAAIAAAGLGLVGMEHMPFVVLVGTIGGLAPDVDSDNSRPVQILFSYATVLVPSVVLWRVEALSERLPAAVFAWCFLALLIRYPVRWLFTRLTVHRGIFHSIPAAGIFGCLGFLWAGRRVDHLGLQSAMGLSALAGYLTHLVLDELWSVDFEGRRIKKSFGTALSLWKRDSPFASVAAYALLAVMLGLTWAGMEGKRPERMLAELIGAPALRQLRQAWDSIEQLLRGLL